jgi:peptidoglycan/xylan/chitin deacetylase (PgdA/CDA1 family)
MEVAITIDVERLYENSEQGTYGFLRLLEEYKIRATFFVTGDIMRNQSGLVSDIARDHHEIASHGYTHPGFIDQFKLPYLTEFGPEGARREIERSREIFEEFGHRVYGYRSPGFRISGPMQRVIGQYFEYDSSIVNSLFRSRKYKRLSRVPTVIENSVEIPVSNLDVLRIPLGSPYFLRIGSKWLMKCLDFLRPRDPTILYFHCFDLVKLRYDCLPHSWLKKRYYFKKCGPENIDFFAALFSYFKKRGSRFKTCHEISQDMKKGNYRNHEDKRTGRF